MRRLLILWVLVSVACFAASQSFGQMSPQVRAVILQKKAPAAVPYVGPGDIVSGAYAWWGFRAYSLASIGGNAVRLRRTGDNAEQDFVTIAGGGLDLAAIATFKGAADLFVRTLYDQTGNGYDLVQATNGNQPAFTLSGIGSLPVFTFDGTDDFFVSASSIAGSPGATASAFFYAQASASGGLFVITDNTNYQYLTYTDPDAAIYAGGSISATASAGSWHAVQGVFGTSTSNSDMNVDGTAHTGNIYSGSPTSVTATVQVGRLPNDTQKFEGAMTEIGYWQSAFSSGQSSSMSSNQHSYWGF
jgi:hypothetical protein